MKLVKIFALILFTTLFAVSFQNCSPSQNTGLLGSKQAGKDDAEKVSIDAPFAYDMVIDTISYNSCVGVDLNSSGVHGIKMGVNEGFVDNNGTGAVKAGLKLRTDFLTYVGKNISPIYPSTVITPAQIQYILQNSDANRNAYLQFAIRRRTDLSPAIDLINPTSSNTVVVPRDGVVDQAPLYADPVLTGLTKGVQFGSNGTLLSEGARLYNLYEVSDVRPIEYSFGYSNYADETYPATPSDGSNTGEIFEPYGFGEAYSDRVRQRFNSSGTDKYIATVTFGDPFAANSSDYGLSNPLRPSSSDKTKAYGRSYAFRFESISTKAGWRSNQLKQITESNLVDNTPASGASWTCENYVVMKQNQWNNPKADEPACVPLTPIDLQNANLAGKVKRLRRHYLESNWNIGLFYPKNSIYVPGARGAQPICVVPKMGECYLPTTMPDNTDIGVNYDPTTECYLYAAPVMGVSYTGNPTLPNQRRLGRCAQYASICVRSSTNY